MNEDIRDARYKELLERIERLERIQREFERHRIPEDDSPYQKAPWWMNPNMAYPQQLKIYC